MNQFYLEFAELKEGTLHKVLFTGQFGLIWDPWGNPKRLQWDYQPGTKLWCDRNFGFDPTKPIWLHKGDMKLFTNLPMMFWTGIPEIGIIIPGKPEPEKWHQFLGISKEEYDTRNQRIEKAVTEYTIAINEKAMLHYAENQEQKEQIEKEWEEWEKRQAEGDDKEKY